MDFRNVSFKKTLPAKKQAEIYRKKLRAKWLKLKTKILATAKKKLMEEIKKTRDRLIPRREIAKAAKASKALLPQNVLDLIAQYI